MSVSLSASLGSLYATHIITNQAVTTCAGVPPKLNLIRTYILKPGECCCPENAKHLFEIAGPKNIQHITPQRVFRFPDPLELKNLTTYCGTLGQSGLLLELASQVRRVQSSTASLDIEIQKSERSSHWATNWVPSWSGAEKRYFLVKICCQMITS